MPRDAKLGLVVGLILVAVIGVVFFRKEPLSVSPASAAPSANNRPVREQPRPTAKTSASAGHALKNSVPKAEKSPAPNPPPPTPLPPPTPPAPTPLPPPTPPAPSPLPPPS